MTKKLDMALWVNVSINGRVDSSGTLSTDVQYSQGLTSPQSSGVVGSSGDVDLRNMAYDSRLFDVDTDITFNLSGLIVDPTGNPVAFNFPSDASQAVTITRQDGGSTNKLRARSGPSLMQVVVADDDNDSSTYSYCLGVQVATRPNSTMLRLDPSIVNR